MSLFVAPTCASAISAVVIVVVAVSFASAATVEEVVQSIRAGQSDIAIQSLNLTRSDMEQLADALKNSAHDIRTLTFTGNQWMPEDFALLCSALTNNAHLRLSRLDLAHYSQPQRLGAVEMAALGRLLSTNPHVLSLNLWANALGAAVAPLLDGLANNTRLVSLDLGANTLTQNESRLLAHLFTRNRALVELATSPAEFGTGRNSTFVDDWFRAMLTQSATGAGLRVLANDRSRFAHSTAMEELFAGSEILVNVIHSYYYSTGSTRIFTHGAFLSRSLQHFALIDRKSVV